MKLSLAVSAGVVSAQHVAAFQSNPEWIHNWIWPLEPRQPLEMDQNISVAILRDPASRIRSAIIDKAIYQGDDEFMRIIGSLCGAYQHYNKKEADRFSFIDLIEAIRWFPDRVIDAHFRSQVSFLAGRYDRLLPFQDQSAIASFFDAVGLTLHTIDAHRVSGRAGNAKLVYPDETIQAVRAEYAADQNTPRAFSPEIEAAIERLAADRYAHDVALWRDIAREG